MADVLIADEDFQKWDVHGRAKALELIGKCSAITEPIPDQIAADVRRMFGEVCYAVADGKLKAIDAVKFLADPKIQELDGADLLFVDTLYFIDADHIRGISKGNKKGPNRLKELAKLAREYSVCSLALLKERLESETLQRFGLIATAEEYEKKLRRLKTSMFYKQQKYNLMREENEGYSKLVTELNQHQVVPAEVMMRNMQSLIGNFALDPNRVLDQILTAFANCRPVENPKKLEQMIALFKLYKTGPTALHSLLGFKFHPYHKGDNTITPDTLFTMAALLIKENLVTLEELYPHLTPAESEIETQCAEQLTKAMKSNAPTKAEDPYKAELEYLEQVNQVGYVNQKLGLCFALVSTDVEKAFQIIDLLPEYHAVSWPQLRKRFCAIIHAKIETLYRSRVSKVFRPRKADANSNVEVCEKLQDLEKTVFPMLKRLGFFISYDVLLMTKVLRLCQACIAVKTSDGYLLQQQVENFLTISVLPSLSIINPGNPALVEEVWKVLKLLPYNVRYCMYGRWKQQLNGHPLLIFAKKQVAKSTSYVMKRLTKDTTRRYGRAIGKLSHSNPGTLFDAILGSVQVYSNLIEPIAESLKYLTKLAFDILAYSLMGALSNPDKQRLKAKDTNLGLWLISLAKFSGIVFRKYSIDLVGILQYIMNKLKSRESFDLLVLKELITKMAGFETTEDTDNVQLAATSGGDTLRSEAGSFLKASTQKGFQKEQRKASNRLRDALQVNDIGIPLMILTAQQLGCIIFDEHDDENKQHMKLVGVLYDDCHLTFIQLTEFLSGHLKQLDPPNLTELTQVYHLSINAAFHVIRPKLAASLRKHLTDTSDNAEEIYLKGTTEDLVPIMAQTQAILPATVWNDISTQLFTTFWSLSLYDMQVPTESYTTTIKKLRTEKEATSHDSSKRARREQERCQNLIDKLKKEQSVQELNSKMVVARLKHEKDTWIPINVSKPALITQFLQRCIFPRCLFTMNDAAYCAKFAQTLHALKTEGWSTLVYYDRVFNDITCTITACTQNEAARYGKFLSETLALISRWHSNKKTFARECGDFPGFKQAFAKKGSQKYISYEDFRHVCHKWHFKITKSFAFLIDSGNFTMIRNALTVLVAVLPHFPKIFKFGTALIKRVESLGDSEKEKQRMDLHAMAIMYLQKLMQQKINLVNEVDFHLKDERPPVKDKAPKPTNGSSAPKDVKVASEGAGDVETKVSSIKVEDVDGARKSSKKGRKLDDRESGRSSPRELSRPTTSDGSARVKKETTPKSVNRSESLKEPTRKQARDDVSDRKQARDDVSDRKQARDDVKDVKSKRSEEATERPQKRPKTDPPRGGSGSRDKERRDDGSKRERSEEFKDDKDRDSKRKPRVEESRRQEEPPRRQREEIIIKKDKGDGRRDDGDRGGGRRGGSTKSTSDRRTNRPRT